MREGGFADRRSMRVHCTRSFGMGALRRGRARVRGRWTGCALAAALVVVAGCAGARAQVAVDGVGARSDVSAFLTVGGENTQLPSYADNALGFDSGVTFQPRTLVGVEFRAGAYPFSARYDQMPFTAGYRVAGRSFLGFPYAPFAYFGGGLARSQDKGTTHVEYSPQWEKCWQVDVGMDRSYRVFSWRLVQASWRETYTPLHALRSISLSTGVVYRFSR
jgi:hypothetical protein